MHTAHAADLYLQHRDVTGSSFYTGSTGAAQLRPLSSIEWVELHDGNTAHLAIRDYGFVVEDAQLNELVYGIANRLLAQWPGTAPEVVIFVQGDRSPLMYSAVTAYTREIFISYGVFLHADSVDELAAVIGHELAHVLLEHTDALGFRKSVNDTLTALNEARNLYAKAESLRFDGETRQVSVDPSLASDLKKSATQRAIAEQLYQRVHASLFSRGAEHEADKLALDLMVAAGYSPMGVKSSLERMAHSHDLATAISDYFEKSSHSLMQQTMAVVDQQLSREKIRAQDFEDFATSFKEEFTESTIDFGEEALWKFSAKSHPVPDERVRQIIDYVYAQYPRSVRRRQPDRASGRLFRSGHIAELINHYAGANRAVESIGLSEFESAMQLSGESVASPTDDDPYMRYVAFLAKRSQGDREVAAAEIEEMSPDSLIPLATTAELTDFLADVGRTERVGSMIDRYEGYYGLVDDYYPPKIKLSAAEQDLAKVASLAKACYEIAPEGSELAARCARASGVSREDVEPKLKDPTGILEQADRLKGLFSN